MPDQQEGPSITPCLIVIDDDAMERQMLIRSLKEVDSEIEFVEVSDPRRALETIAERAPDLALLDIHMPQLNGFEVLSAITAQSGPPVVMLSNSAFQSDHDRALQLGAIGYHIKPATLDGYRTLAHTIRATYAGSPSSPS